jgi:acylpyruvate hydrolase
LLPELVPVDVLADGSGLRVTQRLNGQLLQDGNTDDLLLDIPTLVAYSSHVCSLLPGDVILSGTPDGVGYFREPRVGLQTGDMVEIEVEGVGLLSNPVG